MVKSKKSFMENKNIASEVIAKKKGKPNQSQKPQTNGKVKPVKNITETSKQPKNEKPIKGVKRPRSDNEDSTSKFVKIDVNMKTKVQSTPNADSEYQYQLKANTTHKNLSNAKSYLEAIKNLNKKNITAFSHIIQKIDPKTLLFYNSGSPFTDKDVKELKKSTKAVDICNINAANKNRLKGTLLLKFSNNEDAKKVFEQDASINVGGNKFIVKYMLVKDSAKQNEGAKVAAKNKGPQPKVEKMEQSEDEEDEDDSEDEDDDDNSEAEDDDDDEESEAEDDDDSDE